MSDGATLGLRVTRGSSIASLPRALPAALAIACAAPAPAPPPSPPPGLGLTAVASDAWVDLTLSGAAEGELVGVALGVSGLGAGPCPGGGFCTEVLAPIWQGATRWPAQRRRLSGRVRLDLGAATELFVQAWGSRSGGTAPVAVDVLPAAALTDRDRDGLSDLDEAALGTDPRAADSDGDLLDDPRELEHGTDPLDPDSDADGVPDGLDPWPHQHGPAFPPGGGHVRITPAGSELVDPEFHERSGRVVWQTRDGAEVWVAALDPATGAIVPSDGRGALVTTGVAPMSASLNGPEWMEGPSGPEVVYLDPTGMPYRALERTTGWWTLSIPTGNPVAQPFGSLVPGDPTPWVRTLRDLPFGPLVVQRADGTDRHTLRGDSGHARWTEGEHELVFASFFGARTPQTGMWSPATGFVQLTHSAAWTFKPQRIDGPDGTRYLVVSEGTAPRGADPPAGASSLVVFRDDGGGWARAEVLTGPPALPWIESPETFVWGDRVYATFAASTAPWFPTTSFEMLPWVVSIDGLAPAVHQPACGVAPIEGRDPEPYAGGDTPRLYFTDLATASTSIRMCELALP